MQRRSLQSGQLIESLESRTLLSATTTDLYIRLNGATAGNWIHINSAGITPPRTSPASLPGQLTIGAALNSATQRFISSVTAGKAFKSADLEVVKTSGSTVTVSSDTHFTSVQPATVSVSGSGNQAIKQKVTFQFLKSAQASAPYPVASAPAVVKYTGPFLLDAGGQGAQGSPLSPSSLISLDDFSFELQANPGASINQVLSLRTGLDFDAESELAVAKTHPLTLFATINGTLKQEFGFGSAQGERVSWSGSNGEAATQDFSLAFTPSAFSLAPKGGAGATDATDVTPANDSASVMFDSGALTTLNSFNVSIDLERGKYVPSAQISETLTGSNKLKVGEKFSDLAIILGSGPSHKKVVELELKNVIVTNVTDSILNGKNTQVASFSGLSFLSQWSTKNNQ